MEGGEDRSKDIVRSVLPQSTSFLPVGRWLHCTSFAWDTPASQLLTNVFTSLALIFQARSVGLSSNWSVLLSFFGTSHIYYTKSNLFFVLCSPSLQNHLTCLSIASASAVTSYNQVAGVVSHGDRIILKYIVTLGYINPSIYKQKIPEHHTYFNIRMHTY